MDHPGQLLLVLVGMLAAGLIVAAGGLGLALIVAAVQWLAGAL